MKQFCITDMQLQSSKFVTLSQNNHEENTHYKVKIKKVKIKKVKIKSFAFR